MYKLRFKCFCLAVIGSLLAGISISKAQNEFVIDNSHTSCLFSISHFNIGYIYGRFNQVAGTAKIDKDSPENSRFAFSIQADSIDTNDKGRDKHLQSSEFFDISNHPQIVFNSSSVKFENGVYEVTGKMKLLDVEKELTIPLKLLGIGKGPFGKVRVGMLGKFSIKRSDFGMDKML